MRKTASYRHFYRKARKDEPGCKDEHSEWLIPAALLVLSAVPIAAGAFRVAELTGGGDATKDNARFFASPLPVTLHIFSSSDRLELQ